MSIHINAKKGEIAEKILLPGDPMRAKFIAENFLEDVKLYNQVRGMFGYTGSYKGERISVQGTGMGIPSISIYITELIKEYDVKRLIRLGTCGALQEKVKLNDLILAQSVSTDSSINKSYFKGDFAPCATFDLLAKANNFAKESGFTTHIGNVMSTDLFYSDTDDWKIWQRYNILAVEMEIASLYSIGAKFGVDVLAMCTVSDSLVAKGELTSAEREQSLTKMIELALNTVL